MAYRLEETSYQKINREGDHAWHWRFKGVEGKGIYGSIVTGVDCRGLYLLAEGDFPGAPGWKERLTCIRSPEEFAIAADTPVEAAREAFSSALDNLGWGPRVFR
jgi:hypothetical protein